MSGTATPRLVPDPSSDDDETREIGARVRLAAEADDRSAPRHVFGAPLVLDRSD